MLLQQRINLCTKLSQDLPMRRVKRSRETGQPKGGLEEADEEYLESVGLTLNLSPSPVNSMSEVYEHP